MFRSSKCLSVNTDVLNVTDYSLPREQAWLLASVVMSMFSGLIFKKLWIGLWKMTLIIEFLTPRKNNTLQTP